MTHKYFKTITDWLLRNDVINADDVQLYTYALKSFILMVIPFGIAVIYGFLLNCPTQSFVMIIPFMAIRKFSGGYHAEHLSSCLISSSLLLFFCVSLICFDISGIMMFIAIASSLSLIVNSPIDHVNRKLDNDECNRYKKWTVIWIVLFLLIGIFLNYYDLEEYANSLFVGIVLTGMLQIPCIIRRMTK